MGKELLVRPERFSLKDLNLQVRLETCRGETHFDLTGRKTFSVEFFKEGIGFGITDITIDVNPSLQPIVEITFKDLYGNTIFGTQNSDFTDSDGVRRSSDYSVFFDWPPPKFLLTIKGYLGEAVTWILSLKKHTINYDSSDGSYVIKCSFVPNQWGFFADIPFLFLLSVKGLKKGTANDPSKIETIFDLIKIGKQVEVKTKERTREFDGLLNQLGSIKQNVIGAIINSKIISFDTTIEGVVNGLIIKDTNIDGQGIISFKPLTIRRPPDGSGSMSDEKIKLYSSRINDLEVLNAFTLIHSNIVPSGGITTDFNAFKNQLQSQEVQSKIREINNVVDNNIRLIDAEIKRRVFNSSKTQLGALTISSVFSRLAGDTAYVLGRILQAGINGYTQSKAVRDSENKRLIGKYFPLEFDEKGKQIPAIGVGVEAQNGEMSFVNEFIKAISEGIASNQDLENVAANANLTQTSDALVQRINNLEILNKNPYKPTYDSIASSVLLRSGIAAFVTRSKDPNLPGDYGAGFFGFGLDRDSVSEIKELADNDAKNITDDIINGIPDQELLALKTFLTFFVRLLSDDGNSFLSYDGSEQRVAFKPFNSSTLSDSVKEFYVVIDNQPVDDVNFNDQSTLRDIYRNGDNRATVKRVGDFVDGEIMNLLKMENSPFMYDGFQNVLALERMVHYGIPYMVNNQFFSNDDYYLIMFQGEEVNRITSVNTSPTDSEFASEDKDERGGVGQKEPLGIISLNGFKDDEGNELGRITTINEYIQQGRVIEYSKLKNNLDDFYRVENGNFISGFTDFTWTKKIVERVSNPSEEALPERLAYTVYNQNDGSSFVWDLFYGGDNRGRNQRVYLKRICRNILDRITRIEEQKSQTVGNILGRAKEQQDMIYQQMHNIFHQWQVIALEDAGKEPTDICHSADIISGDFPEKLEEKFAGTTKSESARNPKSSSFIYDYPLNSVRNDGTKIKVENSLINIDPLYKPNSNTTVLNIIQNICQKNNFIFIPIAGNGNYNDISQIFRAYPAEVKPKVDNYFHVLFAPTPESRVKLPSSTFKSKKDFLSTYQDRLDKLNTKALAVPFGSIDNDIIKNVTINSEDNKATAESIVNLQRLVDNENQNKTVTLDCSVLPVLEGRSYKASVETLGNAQIYPMQYFFLENQPLFGGLYQILKVKHSINPNNMMTTFEGIRMRFSPETGYGGVEPITLESLEALGETVSAAPVSSELPVPIRTTLGYDMGEQTLQGAILQGKSYVNRNDNQVKKMLSRGGGKGYTIDYSLSPSLAFVSNSNLASRLNDNKITYRPNDPVYTEAFLDRIDRMVDKFYDAGFAVPGQVILAKIHNESAGTYLPYIVNRVGYMGLIQFNLNEPFYRGLFGASNQSDMINKALAQSNIDQLKQVEEYMLYWFTNNRKKFEQNGFPKDGNGKIMIDAATVYCITFLPAFAYKGLDTDLAVEWEKSGKNRTRQQLVSSNPGLSPDGVRIPKYYLANVLEKNTGYSMRS